MSRKKIKVLLADDHIVVRMGLKAIINIAYVLDVDVNDLIDFGDIIE